MIEYFVKQALEGLQFIEDIGGPEDEEYLEVIERIREELAVRAETYRRNRADL